jgi:hypothetical protein
MQQPGSNDIVGLAITVQQAPDLDWRSVPSA